MSERSNLFRELARVMDMCDENNGKTMACHCIHFGNNVFNDDMHTIPALRNCTTPEDVKFAIGIVEDEPVFVGDIIFYGGLSPKLLVTKENHGHWKMDMWNRCTWNIERK